MKIIKPFITLILICLIVSAAGCKPSHSPVAAKNGMVVCSDRNASEVGLRILKEGGNAIDAAVAMSFALSVTYPGAGNIGGGGFLVYYGNDGLVTTIDFREKAPLNANAIMFLDSTGNIKNNSNHEGLLSVGVPGTVAGLEFAHKKYGKLDWKEVVEPAIKLAENGFRISKDLSNGMQEHRDLFLKYPSSTHVFLKKDSSVYAAGEVWRQSDLANTLKRIQKSGKEDFYNGVTAGLIADFMKNNGGIISMDDLNRYDAIEREPAHITYRGYDIYSMGPPSSGGLVLSEMLNILEGYDLKSLGHNSVRYLHLLTEAMHLAYLDRAKYLGDMDFNPDIPVQMLCSKEYASQQRKLIQSETHLKSTTNEVEQVSEGPNTTHLSVTDAQGNAVSLTYTIEGWYGSGIVVEGAGFLLNNEMGDFNPMPGITDAEGNIGTKPNLIAPGKRMLSSMCPTIVIKDNQPFLVIGTPGGRTIPNTVLQVILNVIDFNMNISDALSEKRMHYQWMPDVTIMEKGILSEDDQKALEKMGHKLEIIDGSYSEAMGIVYDKDNHTYYGKADPRSGNGLAAGY